MTTITKGRDPLTLINVFTPRDNRQDEVVQLLVEATRQTMRNMPGFVSANIHRSFDGKKVVNYAQWESVAAFEAMRGNPAAQAHMQAVAAISAFEPILCEVSEAISE